MSEQKDRRSTRLKVAEVKPLAVSIQDATLLMGISKFTMISYVKRGLVPHFTLGKRVLVSMRVLESIAAGTLTVKEVEMGNMKEVVNEEVPTR